MANYFNQPDDGFKKPAVPTRYRRQTYNTTTQTLCNNVVTTQNTFTSNSLDEIEQRISVFRRLYPPVSFSLILKALLIFDFRSEC